MKRLPTSQRGLESLIAVGSLLALVALLAWGIVMGSDVRQAWNVRDNREAAVEAASNEVLALTKVSSTTSDQAIKRIVEGATKDFRDQFESQASGFHAALRDSNVESTGSIAAAGLVSIGKSEAEVLVAATGTVSNEKNQRPTPRNYRLTVDLEKVEGKWLVSGMDFVQ